MNIVACFKRVPTTESEVKVAPDGTSLDASGLQYMVSFYDEIAVEEAVKIKEAQGGEVTVLSIGPAEATKEMRECLAKGGDKGVLLVDAEWSSRDCHSTAKALAAKLGELGPDLVTLGSRWLTLAHALLYKYIWNPYAATGGSQMFQRFRPE